MCTSASSLSMALIALLVLFASHYFVSFSNSATALECYAAVGGGQCKSIGQKESKCHASDHKSNYSAMREQCCHDDVQESSPIPTPSNVWTNGCSDTKFSTPSPLPFLNVTLLPVHCNTFTLTATWPRSENVSVYKLAVYKIISNNPDDEETHCYSTQDPETTNITLSPLFYDDERSTLYVALWKVVAGQSVLVGRSNITIKNCYSLYTDPVVRYNQCGPYNNSALAQLNSSAVRVCSVSSGKGQVNTTVSWPPVRGANSYEIQIKHYRTLPQYFNVTSATEVTFAGLNQSTYYTLRIQPYIECLGMHFKEWISWGEPCTATLIRPLDLSVDTCTTSRVHSVTVHVLTSNTITSTAQQPSLTSSPLSPSHTPIPDPESSQDHTTPTVTGVSIAVTVAIVLCLLLSLLALLVYCKPRCVKPITPVPIPSREEVENSFHNPVHVYNINASGYIESPSAGVVLVLYSLRTSNQEQEKIHNSLSGLAMYGLSVKTPGTIGPRDISREWLEGEMKQAKAVLLVCNDKFYEEWTDNGTAESDCRLQIGREVRMLKNGKDIELGKFAYIYCEETDKDYSMLSSYIQAHFTLAGTTDLATTIHSIAQFVQNVPDFVYIDTIKC